MRSGEVAGLAGVTVQTLRYYERRGLIARPPRSASGYRTYPPDVVEVVRFIKRAQELGFTLSEIAELLKLGGSGGECAAARAVAAARLAEVERRIAELERMRESLASLVALCDGPGPDRRCSLLHALHPDRQRLR